MERRRRGEGKAPLPCPAVQQWPVSGVSEFVQRWDWTVDFSPSDAPPHLSSSSPPPFSIDLLCLLHFRTARGLHSLSFSSLNGCQSLEPRVSLAAAVHVTVWELNCRHLPLFCPSSSPSYPLFPSFVPFLG